MTNSFLKAQAPMPCAVVQEATVAATRHFKNNSCSLVQKNHNVHIAIAKHSIVKWQYDISCVSIIHIDSNMQAAGNPEQP